MTREFQVSLSEPQAAFLDVRCRAFTIVGELLWYFCSPVTYSEGMGFEFIVIVPLLLSCCDFHFFFERGVSFLVCSSVLLLIVVQQLVAVMVQEEMNRHPPTPLSWNRSLWNTVWSRKMTGELKDTRSAWGWEEWNSVASRQMQTKCLFPALSQVLWTWEYYQIHNLQSESSKPYFVELL